MMRAELGLLIEQLAVSEQSQRSSMSLPCYARKDPTELKLAMLCLLFDSASRFDEKNKLRRDGAVGSSGSAELTDGSSFSDDVNAIVGGI